MRQDFGLSSYGLWDEKDKAMFSPVTLSIIWHWGKILSKLNPHSQRKDDAKGPQGNYQTTIAYSCTLQVAVEV